MEELYSETYVPTFTFSRFIARCLLIAFCVIIAVFDLFVLKSIPGFAFVILIDGIIIMFMPKTKVAYEYVFVDGQIDFDYIINSERRKHKKRVDLEKIDMIAPEGDPALYNERNTKVVDFSSRKPGDRHFIAVCRDEGGKQCIRFTPDEKMLKNIQVKARNKIHC